ncbi:hypothetical protein FB45DRAFT_904385 [Roridomyces roridus]|uniref:ER membrane protein complex subunit 10 n=1 Tax=Roridomyces roridus TaxID=1738132 RepID=A0AAD7C4N1_9AGAR|nr:hypothetical protein FB45DRAFT_904385 [Roridomyces roridus]
MLLLVLLLAIPQAWADRTLQVHHRLYEPNQPESHFSPRGVIHIPDSGDASFEPSASLAQELTDWSEKLQSVKGALYQIALERNGDVIARQWDTSAVKVCHLSQATKETFILHTTHAGEPYALDYFVSPTPHNGACPKKSKNALHSFANNLGSLNTTLVVRSNRVPPLPELRAPPQLTPEGAPVVPVPEKTFIQKYWLYGMAIVLALLMSGGAPEEEGKK